MYKNRKKDIDFRYIFVEITKNLEFKNRIWLETESGILLGRGRLKLLMAIDEYGSINKAAKSIKMSYKKAWKLIDQLNNHAPYPIVETSKGGKGGGGTIITAYGLKIIKYFEAVILKVDVFLEEESNTFNHEINNG